MDVDSDRVVIHRAAGAHGYDHVHSPRAGEIFGCLAYPDLAITLADLLG